MIHKTIGYIDGESKQLFIENTFQIPKRFVESQNMANNIPDHRKDLMLCLRAHLLSKAATVNSVENLLAPFGDDTNYADKYFKCILQAAFINGSFEVFKILEEKGFNYNTYDIIVDMTNRLEYNEDGDYATLLPHIMTRAGSNEEVWIEDLLQNSLRKIRGGNFLNVVCKHLYRCYNTTQDRCIALVTCLRSHLLSKAAIVSSVEGLLATFGDDMNYADQCFKYVLQAAFINGSFEVFKLLEDKGFEYDAYRILGDMLDIRLYKKDGDYAALLPHIMAHAGTNKKDGIKTLLLNNLTKMKAGNFLNVVCKYLYPGYTLHDRRIGLLTCLRSHLLSKSATLDSITWFLVTFRDNINYSDGYFKGILRAAFTNGSLDVFKFLEDRGFQYDAYDIFVYMSNGDYRNNGNYADLLAHVIARVRSEEKEMIRLVLQLPSRTPRGRSFLSVVNKHLSPVYTIPDLHQILLLSLRYNLLTKDSTVSSIVYILAEFGEGINYAKDYFKDILRLAAANGSPEVFKYLEGIGFQYNAFDVLVDMSNGRDYNIDGDYAALLQHVIAHAGKEEEEKIRRVLPYLLRTARKGNFRTVINKYLFHGYM